MTEAVRSAPAAPGWAPALSILVGSSVWGISWYPYRMLLTWGISAALAQVLSAVVATLFISVVYWRRFSTLRASWLLPAIGLAAGVANICFVWGTTHGYVMRVLLLFYLSPVWTALLAQWLLSERLTVAGALLIALALGGAALMLWPAKGGWPVPATPAEWMGLLAGMGFAANNVLVRRASQVLPEMRAEMRTWVMFVGCVITGALSLWIMPEALGHGAAPVSQRVPAALVLIALGVTIAATNVIVQFGLARVAANRAALIMLFEIVVAAVSSCLIAGEVLGLREVAGGTCIVAAGVIAGLLPETSHRDAGKRARAGDAMV
ncbi:hypothetical protein PATSB16_21960 [Pandoraea thiooxydans]|uniref:EamA domain-containing protein n=1 Tax=Pandoraea thiooxydans TaxID=445709 RepID=A0A0G3EQB6_9BURK|nr:DMT family transporter [Pandoraea thiooxydans]AKJ68224.1 hypothetical protein ABW99_08395 [Pandoraea thiooxydans]APR95536.1 hypothetical protein PATSB16_21960 [Pandoraea thiooxydans]